MAELDVELLRALAGDAAALRARAGVGTASMQRALRGALWLESSGGEAPAIDASGAAHEDDPLGALFAHEVAARAAFLRFDGEAHRRALHAMEARAGTGSDVGVPLLALARCRQYFCDGAGSPLVASAQDLEASAARARIAPLVVESAALRALGEIECGQVREGILSARRAARMARTEGLPQPEYLSNVVLARARRFSGRPHLALRILRALSGLVPDPWLPWVAWEVAMTGSDLHAARIATPGDAAARLLEMRGAASVGDRAALASAARAAHARVRSMAPLRAELRRHVVCSDPEEAPTGVEDALCAFVEGRSPELPFGLIGAAALAAEGGDDVVAWVVAGPDRPARRVFGSAAGFASDPLGAGRPGRIETAIAVLLLGPRGGFDKDAYFREVYGFAYRRELHQGPLETLFHRVRKTCGEAITVERSDERVVAHVHRPVVVADPRCAKPLDDRLLRTLAEQPDGSAKDVADALGVPLRTVQAAIKRLADEGACIAERKGRHIVYRVEDTTFSEPTSRAIRRGLA